jgi:DNA-binding response OmpR family regulator
MGTILTVGKNSDLLWSRAETLRRTGAEVRTAHLKEAVAILKAESVDIVILCHTLSELEMMEVASLAREKAPTTRVVYLTLTGMDDLRIESADAVVTGRPETLVAKVKELQRRNHLCRLVAIACGTT